MQIQCSNCGTIKKFGYTMSNLTAIIRDGWNSCGNALYCPECSKTWYNRNRKPMSGKWNTLRVIDEIQSRKR